MFSRSIAFRRAAACTKTPQTLNTCNAFRSGGHSLSTSTSQTSPLRRRARLSTLALTGVLSSSAYLYLQQTSASDIDADDSRRTHASQRQQIPLTTLIRTYVVYSMCSIPFLVDYSPVILSALSSVPGVKQITELLVRATFFSQFVGGDSAFETIPVLSRLRAENKGAILNYSAEVDENEALGNINASGSRRPVHKQVVEEIIRCIDVAADFEDQRQAASGTISGRKTWVAVKLTALLPDAKTFINFSKHLINTRPPSARSISFPGIPRPSDFDVLSYDPVNLPATCPLSIEDIVSLKELKDDLFRVCQRAKERGVTITIDAEHSWYQPAIDAFQLALMCEFNRLPTKASPLKRAVGKHYGSSTNREESSVQPLVYGTFQTYLRRAPKQLAQSLLDAEEGHFALGVKLVRGAYHQVEMSSHTKLRESEHTGGATSSSSISPDALPPVWQTKDETDACFDACARLLMGRVAADVAEEKRRGNSVPRIGLLFGTHSAASCDLVLDALVSEGLAVRTCEVADGEDIVRINIDDAAARRVTIGQLYGMCDALSDSLVDRTRTAEPFIVKYLPYGALSQVMPYLGRRAIENKSVLGGGTAKEERQRVMAEILKRFRGFFG